MGKNTRKSTPDKPARDRDERLAKALRENLRRRKALAATPAKTPNPEPSTGGEAD